jgi:hypothetical protein
VAWVESLNLSQQVGEVHVRIQAKPLLSFRHSMRTEYVHLYQQAILERHDPFRIGHDSNVDDGSANKQEDTKTMRWHELNSREVTFKRILVSERTWHFRLFLLTYTINDKLPIFLCALDTYLLRVCFFWLIVPYCWTRNLIKRKLPQLKNARWKHIPRVEFVQMQDSVKEYIDVGGGR